MFGLKNPLPMIKNISAPRKMGNSSNAIRKCPIAMRIAPMLLKPTADQRRQKRAEVDAHVEDRVSTVAPAVVRSIEPAHLHRHVRLEKPVADDQEHQRSEEDGQIGRASCRER